MPAPPPLRFVGPTPKSQAIVSTGSVAVQVDASCSFDPATLAVSLNGAPISSSQLLPFGACSGGRMQSQVAAVPVSLPAGTITGGSTSLNAGDTGSFSATSSGDSVHWNFDGGAAPADGPSVSAVFQPAGDFTVRAQATASQSLQASGMDGVNLVTAARDFRAGDPSPDTLAVHVAMPPDVDFVNFELSQVHPIAYSAAAAQVYALDTPQARLSIFDVASDGSLTYATSVAVGLGPVSLALRPGTSEVWVANHLSDSVSIVDAASAKVVATLPVGDEPTDVAFASGRAFVSISGQRDAVVVLDAASRTPITTLDIFGDDPRALAVSPDGSQVYLVVLESGNQTTTLFHEVVTSAGGPPPPSPPRTVGGQAPAVGLIVQFDPASGKWLDDTGGDWSSSVDFSLPDQDVFVIDAAAPTPAVVKTVAHVGTILFDVSVQPGTGQVFVADTDARNGVRFEPNLRGHLVQTRLSRVDPVTGAVTQFDLNPHINFSTTPGPASELALSLAHPGDGVFSSDGSTYYLTAFGSRKVGVVDATSGAVMDRIDVGGGPSGVALNEGAGRLYVVNRLDNTLSLVDTTSNTQVASLGIGGPAAFDPSPDVIQVGRKFLYDAQLTSGHGDISCATCHVFANFDNLAWDLGDPQGAFLPYTQAPWVQFFAIGGSTSGFDPMKGPMTTQSLRGLQGHEPFHWRGGRQFFQSFNGAMVTLMGRATELPTADMDAFDAFIKTVRYPPNPYRNLDDSLPTSITVPDQATGTWSATGNPAAAATSFVNDTLDGPFSCNNCHALPTGTNTQLFNGNAEGESQDFKIPQMRNMYEKVGFDVVRPQLASGGATNIGQPQQKAGFGFLHDGSVSLTEFLAAGVFNLNTQAERDMFAFALAFPTETKPCVGHKVGVDTSNRNDPGVVSDIATLMAQAVAGSCDLAVKGSVGGAERGYLFDPTTSQFLPDSILEDPLGEAALRGLLLPGDQLTYQGVPPGAGRRLALDRDRDGWFDHSEAVLGTDPDDPNSNPWQW